MDENGHEASIERKLYVSLISDNDFWVCLGESTILDPEKLKTALDKLKKKYVEQYPALKDNPAPFCDALMQATKELAPFRY